MSPFLIQSQLSEALKRKFTIDVIWNTSSLILSAALGLLINIVIANQAGNEALGIFNQVFAIYIVVSQLGVGGLQFSSLKHISQHADDKKQCAEIYSSAFVLVAIASGLLAGISFFSSAWVGVALKNPDVGVGLQYAALGILFFSLNKVLMLSFNAMRHMRTYALIQTGRFLLLFVFVFIIHSWGGTAAQLCAALTGTEILLFFLLFYHMQTNLFAFSWGPGVKRYFPIHINFGIKGVLSGILVEFNTRVDILLLGYISGDNALVGIYSFPALLAEGLCQIPIVIRQNLDPIIGRKFASNKKEEILQMARTVRRFFIPGMAAVCGVVLLSFPFVYRLIMEQKENAGVSTIVLGILLAGILINAGFRPFMGIFFQGGKPEIYTLLVVFLCLLNVVLNFALIPKFSLYGSATATAIVFVVEALLITALSRKILKTRII